MTGPDHPAGRWLTYNEIGEMLGVSPEAARAVARRGKWPRQTANAVGRVVRVLVPDDRLRLAAANRHDNAGHRSHPDSSGPNQRPSPEQGSGEDDSGHRPEAVESGLSQRPDLGIHDSGQWPNPDTSGLGQRSIQVAANGQDNMGHRPGPDESGRNQRTDLAALHEIAETFMAPVREQLIDLKVQLVAERDRADRAEVRATEFQQQLQAEMVEHRRVVGMLTEQLSTRRSWWRWRRR